MKGDGRGISFCQNCGFKITSKASVCVRCGSEVKN